MENRVGIIVVRLGNFDDYIDFWVHSAAQNKSIDFLIFTDNKLFESTYRNISNFKIKIINKEFIEQKIKEITGKETRINKPYKLCDFKPAYGLIFKNELTKYDYWGFCDTDLIFGNIDRFIYDKLEKYDRFYNLGHLNIFRNTDFNNSLFLKELSNVKHLTFKMAVLEDENIYFDEYYGLNKIWDNTTSVKQYKSESDYFDASVFSFKLKDVISKEKAFFKFESGKLYKVLGSSKSEILYLHLQKRHMIIEKNSSPNYPFFIINNKILNCDEKEAARLAKKAFLLRSFFYFIKQKIKYYKSRLKRKYYVKFKAKTNFHKICY